MAKKINQYKPKSPYVEIIKPSSSNNLLQMITVAKFLVAMKETTIKNNGAYKGPMRLSIVITFHLIFEKHIIV